MSYYLTNENSFLNINNAHLKVSGNVHADVMKIGAVEFAPTASNVTTTTNFTNVTTGLTTSSNLHVGGTLTMGTVEVIATTHNLENITTNGNVTPHTVEFQNTGTSLVASGNVEVASNLTVNGNVETKNINMLHTANTASIKLNSNVVTEFPRSKKLIKYPRVALGTNTNAYSGVSGGSTVSGYSIKASSEYNGDYLASKAFTNTNVTDVDSWISSASVYSSTLPVANSATLTKFGQQGSWLEIKLPNAIRLHFTRIFNRRTHIGERNDTADIWASNTGNDGEWVKLTTINFNDSYTDSVPMVAEIDTQTYYQYFAIQITKLGWSGTYANIGEWELYGVPEYDPEAHGTDVVVKSVPNVPDTDWLEVYYDAKDLGNGIITAVDDLTPNGTNDGTATGDLTVSDGVFTFDGTNDYITSTTLSSHFTGDPTVTYACWVKFNAMTTNQMFFTINAPGVYLTGEIGGLFLATDGTLYNTVGSRGIQTVEKLVTDRWYHLVGTKVPGNTGLDTQKLYINGIRAAVVPWSASGNQVIGSNPVMRIGAAGNGTSDKLNGSMANARLFKRALSSDEVWQLYAYQKEYFGHGDLNITLKAGRLGIGTSEPRAALDVREGSLNINGMTIAGNFPSSPPNSTDGTLYYDTTQRRLYVLEDGNWVSLMGDINNSTSFQPSDITDYYAHYQASNYSNGVLSDLSGNGRDGTGVSGRTVNQRHAWHGEFGAKSYFATLYATESAGTTGKVSLHPDVLPPLYTIVALTRRYTPPDLAQIDHIGRIISHDPNVTSSHASNAGYGVGNNWLLGHWNDQNGTAYFGGWISTNVSSGVSNQAGQYGKTTGSKWLISIGKPGYYTSKVQGSDWNTNTISNTNNSGYKFDAISIGYNNSSIPAEAGHWEFAEMIVYGRELLDNEIEQLKRHMQAKYNIY